MDKLFKLTDTLLKFGFAIGIPWAFLNLAAIGFLLYHHPPLRTLMLSYVFMVGNMVCLVASVRIFRSL